jgi:predicted AAA+ superfamily ATPase
MIARRLAPIVHQRLADVLAVAHTGPRQVGKTMLALAEAAATDALYLDLESERRSCEAAGAGAVF